MLHETLFDYAAVETATKHIYMLRVCDDDLAAVMPAETQTHTNTQCGGCAIDFDKPPEPLELLAFNQWDSSPMGAEVVHACSSVCVCYCAIYSARTFIPH